MELPIRIMLDVAAFFTLFLAVLGVFVWRPRHTCPGWTRWATSNVLLGFSLVLYALQLATHQTIASVGANAAIAAGAILYLEASREYCGRSPRVFPAYAGGIIAVLAVVYFRYVAGNLNGSIVAMSAFMGVLALFTGFTLFEKWLATRRMSLAVTAGMFAISASLLLARAIYFFFAPPLVDLFAPSRANTIFFLGCAFSVACCTVAWRQLIQDRVLIDLKEAESRTAQSKREVAEATIRANSMAQRAASADAARREFLETMNHSIRNPLGGVMAATDLLLDTELTPEQQEYTLALRTGAETLLKVNDDLLDLSRIEAGEVTIESSVFDLRSLLEDVLKTFAHVAGDKAIDLALDYHAGIPSRFRGDGGKLRQVVRSLVWSALRFTPSGQIVVAVECEARDARRAQIRVSVSDNGIGIPPETLRSLLERPSEGPRWASRIRGGTGTGLIVSKKTIELMGGRLSVENQPGNGSKFWFTLSLEVEDAA